MLPIHVVLTEKYSDWEIAVLCGVGRSFYGADIRFVSPSGSALTSAGGLRVVDLAPFPHMVEGVLVVCGGPALESGAGEAMAATLQRTRAGGGIVAGICGGTIALAAAGLLDDVRHTSNGPDYLASHVPAYRGERHFEGTGRAVHCDRIITAPAPAPASFAAEVLLAAGLKAEDASGILAMLAAEHRA